MRTGPIAAALLGLLALTACDGETSAAKNAAAPAPVADARGVAAALTQAGLPLVSVEAVDRAHDPDKLLGMPGQYTSKAFFYDRRHPAAAGKDGQSTIEVFTNVADTMRRGEVLSQTSRLEDISERQMIQGRAYLRLGHALSAAEAGEYRKAMVDRQIGL